jgi:hypothetical protein
MPSRKQRVACNARSYHPLPPPQPAFPKGLQKFPEGLRKISSGFRRVSRGPTERFRRALGTDSQRPSYRFPKGLRKGSGGSRGLQAPEKARTENGPLGPDRKRIRRHATTALPIRTIRNRHRLHNLIRHIFHRRRLSYPRQLNRSAVSAAETEATLVSIKPTRRNVLRISVSPIGLPVPF